MTNTARNAKQKSKMAAPMRISEMSKTLNKTPGAGSGGCCGEEVKAGVAEELEAARTVAADTSRPAGRLTAIAGAICATPVMREATNG
jgi:hypothetical protein